MEVGSEVLREDWEILTNFLPERWREKAKELGAIRRFRKIKTADQLLRILMIHIAEGCSLRETTVRVAQGDMVQLSDVALLKRLRGAGEWLRWLAEEVMKKWVRTQPVEVFKGRDVNIIDATTVQEPGATGSTWKIHYSIDLTSLQCREVHVTSCKTGETFKNFTIQKGRIYLGDRGYATRGGVAHVVKNGGDVIIRMNLTNLPLVNDQDQPIYILEKLRSISITQVGDWDVFVIYKGEKISGRLIAIKKSKKCAEKARKKMSKENKKKGITLSKETLESADYTFVFTTLNREEFPASTIMEMYRGRWQIEVNFKRLKSIIGLSHLKKKDLEGAVAWLHGKLFIAFLIEAMITAGDDFFPWGYPISFEM